MYSPTVNRVFDGSGAGFAPVSEIKCRVLSVVTTWVSFAPCKSRVAQLLRCISTLCRCTRLEPRLACPKRADESDDHSKSSSYYRSRVEIHPKALWLHPCGPIRLALSAFAAPSCPPIVLAFFPCST